MRWRSQWVDADFARSAAGRQRARVKRCCSWVATIFRKGMAICHDAPPKVVQRLSGCPATDGLPRRTPTSCAARRAASYAPALFWVRARRRKPSDACSADVYCAANWR